MGLFLYTYFNYVYVCVLGGWGMPMSTALWKAQSGHQIPWSWSDRLLWAVWLTWILGTELGFSARIAHTRNPWVISPAPDVSFNLHWFSSKININNQGFCVRTYLYFVYLCIDEIACCFLRQGLSLAWNSSPSRLTWLSSQPQGSRCPCLHSTGITRACPHTQLFLNVGSGFKPRSSCLCGKHFVDWVIFPTPWLRFPMVEWSTLYSFNFTMASLLFSIWNSSHRHRVDAGLQPWKAVYV